VGHVLHGQSRNGRIESQQETFKPARLTPRPGKPALDDLNIPQILKMNYAS
jgi:hypothetical protein